jgi:ribonuclease BN (tRNA processing enzyme)
MSPLNCAACLAINPSPIYHAVAVTDLELTFIGSGNAFVSRGNCWNGFVANKRVLFEAPPSALMSLNRFGIDPGELQFVVISHHHGDHFLGLPMLILHWKHIGLSGPVTIIGPPRTRANTEEIASRVFPGLFDEPMAIEWSEVGPGQTFQSPGFGLRAVAVEHDKRLVCLGFACQIDGRRLSYTGDAAFGTGVLDIGRDSEVLVAECTSRSDEMESHMNLVNDISRLRTEIDSSAHILLTHLGDELEDTGLHRTVATTDGQTFRF